MAEVKWIKITTNIFDDEKIKLIDTMPDRDALLVIWFKLLTMAGKTNDNGFLYIIKEMPTTDEMLATIFNRPLNTVRLALDLFKKFGMIEINNHVNIVNWEKHQNIEGLDKIKEQNRLRQQKRREKIKEIEYKPKKDNVMSRDSHETDIDLELEKKKNNKDIYTEIFNHYLSKENLTKHKNLVEPMKKSIALAIKTYDLDLDYLKKIIDRHSEKIEQTKNSEFPVSQRTLQELFGQKKYKSQDLICADYLDEKYTKTEIKEKPQQIYEIKRGAI